MSDLINRNALILHLNDWALSVSGNDKEYEDVQAFIKCVDEWASENQWIKCSDRLPPLGEEVLVWAYDRCYLLTLYAYPNDEGYYWNVEDYDIADDEFDKVIAWMPLPEYEEEE